MNSILDRIVAYKRQEIAAARQRLPDAELERRLDQAPPPRDFRAALERQTNMAIIAEVKKASPSAGLLRADFDPVAIARTYDRNGAACISVLTDEPSFQGHLHYLSAIRAAVSLPLLRKDFILDRYQLLEARLAGADAALLIAEILDEAALHRLLREAAEVGLQTLVELYERANLPRVLASGARLIGINNRDLHTFQTRLEHTLELLAALPPDVCLVSESGIGSRADIERLQTAGVRAVLIGETFMRAPDIGAKLRELRGMNGPIEADSIS
jgi:indole-3-glycerol phosphate synthase